MTENMQYTNKDPYSASHSALHNHDLYATKDRGVSSTLALLYAPDPVRNITNYTNTVLCPH